jgi:hypothetical protein
MQGLTGSVSFRGKLRSGQVYDYHKLYHAAEIRFRQVSRQLAVGWVIRGEERL